MEAFKEIKNRDAWSTLRGFVYQVDTTILRWLNLKEDELLELEKGEDIDIITRDVENYEITRELEQIKYREANITLNSDISLEMLLNFFAHKTNNPDHKLYFRFVTNTRYGTERPALFLDGKAGIDVWIELFNSKKIDETDEKYLNLKKHLLKRIKERILEDSLIKEGQRDENDQWKAFYTYIETDKNLIQTILDFEWSFGNNEHVSLSETVLAELIKLNIAENRASAENIYSKLFLFVFRLLCNKSTKKLDQIELQKQIETYTLKQSDERLLNFIHNLISSFNDKIYAINNQLDLHSKQISQLVNDKNLIADANTIFDLRLKNISITPPTLIKNGTLRKEKVNEIKNLFSEHSWIHFYGINGTGKSQLAALICNEFRNFWWLDLRAYNQDIEKTTLLVESFLFNISNCPVLNDRDVWINMVLKTLSKDTLIVLNDLPRIDLNSDLSKLLILFGNSVANTNHKILTTSNYAISNEIKSSLNQHVIQDYSSFEFSDNEIIEFLVNNGAPESIIKYINLIIVISKRNPRLTSTIIHQLKAIDWGKDSNKFVEVILGNEFTKELLEDAQLSIKKYISNIESRELLYRLSLIHWSFRNKEILAVSDIKEKIVYPNEKLQDLLHIWIQALGDEFQISPIIEDIGINNLSEATIQAVHLAVARSLLSTKRVDQISATRIISSFIKGKDFNNAGQVLLNLYLSVRLKEEVEILESWGFLDYWISNDIPKEMDIVLRAFIRKEQIRLCQIINREFSIFEDKLEKYSEEVSINKESLFIVHLLILNSLNVKELSDFWRHLDYVLRNWISASSPFKDALDIRTYSDILWSPIQKLVTAEDINQWLSKIDSIESEFDVKFFEHEIAQSAINIICRNIVSSGLQQEPKEWQKIIHVLQILVRYFSNHQLEILQITVLKEIISFEFKTLNNRTKALELTNDYLLMVKHNESKFLLSENIGKLYFNDNQKEKSKEWLISAINFECTNQTSYIDTLLLGASVLSNENSKVAVLYCLKAKAIAENDKDYGELNYIQLIGELAIAYWIDKDYINSFQAFEDFLNRLFRKKEENFGENWKRLLLWCGHSTGYISAEVAGNHIPKFISSGEEYVKPYQGIFTLNNKDLSELYNSNNEPVIFAQMAIFSDGINNISKAYEWSLRAFDLARKNGDQKIFLLVSSVCSQYSLVNFKIEEAFESFLLLSALNSHLMGTPREKMEKMAKAKISDVLLSKPSPQWNVAEENTLEFVILPAFLMILTAFEENSVHSKEYAENFTKMLRNYYDNSSDKLLWELVIELTTRITKHSITERELAIRGNTFGEQERKGLQIICILGTIYLSKNSENILIQIVNVMPYLTKIYSVSKSLTKFVLSPFVKVQCLKILKDNFVGTKQELEAMTNEISTVDSSYEKAIQNMLVPLIKVFDINILDDRKAWLYEFKDI